MPALAQEVNRNEPVMVKAGPLDSNVPQESRPSGELADSAYVDDHYFDDVVFVGDSITVQLRNYVAQQREESGSFMGGAQFLARGSLGSGNVQEPVSPGSLHPAYLGEKMMLEDSIAATGAKKAYLMLGMNDIGLYGVDASIENLDRLVDKIREESPDIQIIVQSVTPILAERQRRTLNNANILLYNEKLRAMCEEKGYAFVDVASVFRSGSDALLPQYCSDADTTGIHLSDAACEPWVEFLRTHPVAL